jgi:hypothetical protein
MIAPVTFGREYLITTHAQVLVFLSHPIGGIFAAVSFLLAR